MSSADWTEPGAHEVAPGVHRIPLPMPGDGLRAVNVYAIRDTSTVTLIDGGWALDESRNQLAEALATLGAELSDIARVLVTHVHRDHYTQAVTLRGETGCRIALGAAERPNLRCLMASDHVPMRRQREQLLECGAKNVVDALEAEFGTPDALPPEGTWQEPDEWLEESTPIELERRTLRVVPTPGHTRGHVMFLDETEGLMFTGDHVLPHITPSVALEQAPGPVPLRDFLDSLRLTRSLPDTRMLPAHGPAGSSVHTRVDELLRHHERRLTTMTTAVAEGAETAHQTARTLTWTRHGYALDELDTFNRTLAILETAAHLKLLTEWGRLDVELVEGVAHYTAN
ncbi:Glyoxylase, beta-lactamase superfamily II [Actinopolyspora lacussalsi subsp. righensis]|uniref:Glyoxylase, beta-lactamase superfamily II n=1 Tax=Actinopolyspora righensis TaxID=995060 RepID=A0A1I6X5B7_9ACTN|nr:MBL fold metallo-hydrolase [Actinopolyspora righensis]SFT33329.1 Glyoxylase, beta-lactamase superfamily II [Actinopolyspora righensis]